MIRRVRHRRAVQKLLREFPVVAILGARQVGKTTLALRILEGLDGPGERFDLEDSADLSRLSDPRLALGGLRGLVVQQLPPWHADVGKRQVKAPKVYIRDSGLLHALLDIRDRRDLERHPKVGASWEGFLLRQVLDVLEAAPEECSFWAAHAGPEIDLLWARGRRRWGFEFKRTSSPKLTRSLHGVLEALGLQKAFVVHAGEHTFPLHERVTALAAQRILSDLPKG